MGAGLPVKLVDELFQCGSRSMRVIPSDTELWVLGAKASTA